MQREDDDLLIFSLFVEIEKRLAGTSVRAWFVPSSSSSSIRKEMKNLSYQRSKTTTMDFIHFINSIQMDAN